MTMITVRGLKFPSVVCRDSFSRRAVQYQNSIINTLVSIGVKEDDIDIPMENVAVRKVPARVSWYFNGYNLHYSYHAGSRFVDNLYVANKLIEIKVNALVDGEINVNDFISEFSEDKDVDEQRKEAREALGVSHDTMDFQLIDRNYKILAKEFHPDMPNGNLDRFKKINKAHKILKRELE